jgi:hypothetical protein
MAKLDLLGTAGTRSPGQDDETALKEESTRQVSEENGDQGRD